MVAPCLRRIQACSFARSIYHTYTHVQVNLLRQGESDKAQQSDLRSCIKLPKQCDYYDEIRLNQGGLDLKLLPYDPL